MILSIIGLIIVALCSIIIFNYSWLQYSLPKTRKWDIFLCIMIDILIIGIILIPIGALLM